LDRNQPVWRHLFEGEEFARSDPLIVSCCFVYGIILVNCVLYDRGVNVPELPLRLVKEIRNWKNQIPSGHRFAACTSGNWPYETIALIDAGSEVRRVSLGILVSAPRAP
jgi:hypothetical protein